MHTPSRRHTLICSSDVATAGARLTSRSVAPSPIATTVPYPCFCLMNLTASALPPDRDVNSFSSKPTYVPSGAQRSVLAKTCSLHAGGAWLPQPPSTPSRIGSD